MLEEDCTPERMGYVVSGAGWAKLSFRADADAEPMVFAVSYLHDSLGDLARMGVELVKGAQSATAVFMDEPGEVQLVVNGRKGNKDDKDDLSFELRGYPDWASWDMTSADNYKVLASGVVRRADLVRNIHAILERIYVDLGLVRYRELWVEHDFPLRAYEVLVAAFKKRPQAF
ncbi:hypothetical protein VLK31_20490 [Variovorax sp. H27-G14]|uniref:hypothetical protein n=1 Tax=Variovorax sp. H27-G14 TaxID=3111914 RepID=UPI0038FCB6F6